MHNDLIKQAKKQDKQAFSTLYDIYLKDLYKIAKAILKRDEDVEDALQETAFICWQKLPQLKNEKFFKTWLIRILINECNTVLKKRQMLPWDAEAEEKGEEDYGYLGVEWELFLNVLDEKHRLVIILHYAQGYKVREIARIMEVGESSVKKYLVQARNKLEEMYEKGELK